MGQMAMGMAVGRWMIKAGVELWALLVWALSLVYYSFFS
jgi:hypothetical protein